MTDLKFVFNTVDQAEIVQDVLAERRRQDRKYGVQNHSDEKWMTILMEEVGEAARIIRGGHDGEHTNLREELVHVAAVVVAWLEQRRRQ